MTLSFQARDGALSIGQRVIRADAVDADAVAALVAAR